MWGILARRKSRKALENETTIQNPPYEFAPSDSYFLNHTTARSQRACQKLESLRGLNTQEEGGAFLTPPPEEGA